MNSGNVVTLDSVSKSFGGITAVDKLSLQIPAGTVFGLLGPNGAGKTTTIRMLLEIVVPDSGSIELFGLAGRPGLQAGRIGYLPEERGLYQGMRVLDVLVFLAEVKGIARKRGRIAASQWLERMGLSGWKGSRVRELSKGMQQKIQFIGAVMHGPELLVLDEPFAGLDAVNAEFLGGIVRDLAAGGTTVVFSTHIMEQAESLCDRVCIMSRGRELVVGSVDSIKAEHGRRMVRLVISDGVEAAQEILQDLAKVALFEQDGDRFQITPSDLSSAAEVVAGLVGAGARVDEIETRSDSLREIFLNLMGRASNGADGA
jgi:ABC-2 type transport system ATP-binding protein